MSFDMSQLGSQMDSLSDEQVVNAIETLRVNRGLLGPAIKMFAAKFGAAEWADVILSPDTTRDQLVRLFAIVKEEKANGPDAIRAAVLSDPITGPLVAKQSDIRC